MCPLNIHQVVDGTEEGIANIPELLTIGVDMLSR
jgi:hypothetical protein